MVIPAAGLIGRVAVGAAQSGSAGLAVGAAAGPPGWVVTGILLGVSLIGAALKKKPKAPPPEAAGFTLRENPTDPTAPWLVPYGEGWVRPPLLQQAVSPAALNGMKAARQQRLTKTFHCGAGPMDGRDFRLKHGGLLLWDVVDEDAPLARRLMTDVSGARTQYVIPAGGVDHASVAIYFDGALVGTSGGGATTTQDPIATVASKAVAPQQVTKTGTTTTLKDSTIPSSTSIRTGGILPTQGTVDSSSVKLTLNLNGSGQVAFQSGETLRGPTIAVPKDDVALGRLDDGTFYFYLLTVNALAKSAIKSLVISYTVLPGAPFVLTKNSAQRTLVNFKTAVASGVQVTATYRTTAVSDDFAYVFRLGEREQEPVAFDEDEAGDRATHLVGGELEQGTVRRYSTANEVDEVVVGIESGPEGFFSTDGGFGPIARHVQIRLKESSAPDGIGTGTNLASGWIDMKNPSGTGVTFRLEDFLQGATRWFFGMASLYAYTRDGKLDATQAHYLPRKGYDVEVVATDPANANNKGTVNASLHHSELHFATATEVRRIGLVVPYHSDLSLQIDQDESIGLDDLVECRAKWRKVWVPASNSVYSAATARPEPGEFRHTRNPVWIACDHVVDRLFGGGRHFGWHHIAQDATRWARTLAAAAYCDAAVNLPDGTQEARALCDITLGEDGTRSLGEQVAAILAGSGTLAFWRGGWNFLVDQSDDPAQDQVSGDDFTIVEDDDLEGATLEMLGIEDIPTEIEIAFRDRDKDDERDIEPITLDDPQPSPRVVWRREFQGVRRRTQARRSGSLLLQQSRRHLRTVTCVGTWGRGLRLLQLDPGDIVRFTSARLGLSGALFRVFVTGWASEMKPGLVLVQHDPAAYGSGYQGPSSAVPPGHRKATDELPAPSKLTVKKVLVLPEIVYL